MKLGKLTYTILVVTFLTSSLAVANNLPSQSRELLFIDAGKFEVGIDNDPRWAYQKEDKKNVIEFTAQTPENYYPPSVIHITYHKDIAATGTELKKVAESAIKQAEANFGVSKSTLNSMKQVTFRNLSGYEVIFRAKVGSEIQDIKLTIAKSPKGNMLSLMTLTLPDKLAHIQPAAKRLYDNITFKK